MATRSARAKKAGKPPAKLPAMPTPPVPPAKLPAKLTPPDPANFLTLVVVEKDNATEVHFRMPRKKTMEKMFQLWTERRAPAAGIQFQFKYNHQIVKNTDTPESLGLEENARIVAYVLNPKTTKATETPLLHSWPLRYDPDQSYFQELVRQKVSEYICPLMPFPVFEPSNVFPTAFGPDMQQANFLIQPNVTYLNHGSFGATPAVVLHAQQKWQAYIESNCSRFFHYQYSSFTAHAIRCLAGMIGAEPADTVFVDNATTGVNAVLQSLNLTSKDSLLYLEIGYGPLIKFYKYLKATRGVELIEVRSALPIDMDQLVEDIEAAVLPNTKVAVIDHISSPIGALLPLGKIIRLLKEKGVFVCVDGAHAIGQVSLNLLALNADAYTSNCHKWMYASKGCGFLWINPKHRNTIHPTVFSAGTALGQNAEFNWLGTRDYSPWLSVMSAIEFYNYLGPDRVRSYNNNLAASAAIKLMEMWQTKTILKSADWREHSASMVTVAMPVPPEHSTPEFASKLRSTLLVDKGVDMICYAIQGTIYCRISAQIYLDLEDFVMLGEDVLHYIPILISESSESSNSSRIPPIVEDH